jgi:carboxylate-amine ligase
MHERLDFVRNNWPSLGVEIELQLVDAETLALRNAINDILPEVPASLSDRVKPEIMQSYLEINTEICQTAADVGTDLAEKLRVVEEIVDRHGLRLLWAGTHPFSKWYEQRVTPDDRYFSLVDLLQDTARRLVTFGLHVHVGVDSGDKAIMICDRMLRHLPTLLALSANSPFWGGRNTGLHSQRSKVMEDLPTAGMPPVMRNWSEYVWLLNHLVETNFIRSLREIWWDVRPHHNFGTVEVRICDMPPDLPSVVAIAALVQCLVRDLSRQIDEGTYLPDGHPFMTRQNKWRACRYGMAAELVDPFTAEPRPARRVVSDLVETLRRRGVPEELGCLREIEMVLDLAEQPTGSERQVAIFEQTGDPAEVVRQMLERRPFEPAASS